MNFSKESIGLKFIINNMFLQLFQKKVFLFIKVIIQKSNIDIIDFNYCQLNQNLNRIDNLTY